jgi:hypothetical protein
MLDCGLPHIGAPFTVGYWVQERTSPAHFRMSLTGCAIA